jgi:hypothetical protein
MRLVRRFSVVLIAGVCFTLLLTLFRLVQADSLPPVSDQVLPKQTNWTETLSLPRFNPLSGTLTSVQITLSGVVSGRVGFESLDSAPATLNLHLTATIAIRRPDHSVIFLVVPNAQLSEQVPAYDGVTDYGGTSGGERLLSASLDETYLLTNPADLALFIGSGAVDLPAVAVGSSSASGPGNVRLLRQAQAAGVFATAEYLFVNPAIQVEKTVYLGHDGGARCPGQELAVGDPQAPVTYCFQVINTGDTYLDSLVLTDTTLGIDLGALTLLSGTTPLAPGASLFYAYDSAIAQPLLNLASVEANPTDANGVDIPNAPNPTDSDTAEVDLIAADIDLIKTVYRGQDGGVGCPGVDLVQALPDTGITYCFQIVNTGNTYLS